VLVAWAVWLGDGRSTLHRLLAILAAATGLVAATSAVAFAAMRQGNTAAFVSCVLPARADVPLAGSATLFRSGTLGPLPLGLAVLGAFSYLDRLRQWRTWWAIALAAAVAIGTMADPTMLAPVWAGSWCLAAIGLSEIFRESQGRMRTISPGVLVAILLVVLEVHRFSQREPPLASADTAHAILTSSEVRRKAATRAAPASVVQKKSLAMSRREARDWMICRRAA
jgi:hypothetical protein